MSMVFCRACGKQVDAAARTCPGCGALQGETQAAVAQVSTEPERSEMWARRFALIEKAGGASLPNLRKLPFREVWAVKANFLAFLLGPIYYAAKGMWKKGVTLFVLLVVALGGAEAFMNAMGLNTSALLLVGPAVFSRFANVTYFRLVKERRNAWW